MGLPVDFEPIRTPFRYYKNGTNCHERILGRCTCKRNKGSKGCWGRLKYTPLESRHVVYKYSIYIIVKGSVRKNKTGCDILYI